MITADHPRRRQVELHQRDERRGDQQLVGDRIEHLAEPRDLLAAARQVAVEPVGERREAEDRGGDQLDRARRGRARPSNFVSSTDTSSGHQEDAGDASASSAGSCAVTSPAAAGRATAAFYASVV